MKNMTFQVINPFEPKRKYHRGRRRNPMAFIPPAQSGWKPKGQNVLGAGIGLAESGLGGVGGFLLGSSICDSPVAVNGMATAGFIGGGLGGMALHNYFEPNSSAKNQRLRGQLWVTGIGGFISLLSMGYEALASIGAVDTVGKQRFFSIAQTEETLSAEEKTWFDSVTESLREFGNMLLTPFNAFGFLGSSKFDGIVPNDFIGTDGVVPPELFSGTDGVVPPELFSGTSGSVGETYEERKKRQRMYELPPDPAKLEDWGFVSSMNGGNPVDQYEYATGDDRERYSIDPMKYTEVVHDEGFNGVGDDVSTAVKEGVQDALHKGSDILDVVTSSTVQGAKNLVKKTQQLMGLEDGNWYGNDIENLTGLNPFAIEDEQTLLAMSQALEGYCSQSSPQNPLSRQKFPRRESKSKRRFITNRPIADTVQNLLAQRG